MGGAQAGQHLRLARPPCQELTSYSFSCHDPHTTEASCTAAGCHADQPDSPGHIPAHAQVTCGACHDAGGLQVGPFTDRDGWGTFQTVTVAGRDNVKELQAHNLQRSVDCTRCHFPGNPWELSTEIAFLP